MISPETYKSLQLYHQAEILWSRGKFIEAIESPDFDVSLYSFDGLFVELYYCIKKNQVEEIKIVEDQKRLKFYTKKKGNEL